MLRVSTIIPVYNGAATIGRAIDSALAQEFDGQEVIVVNDGSTDNTAAVLAEYGDRIRVVMGSNEGAARSRDRGAALSKSEYLAFLDCDDLWEPQKLAKVAAALDMNPHAILAYSDYIAELAHCRRTEPARCGGPHSLLDLFRGAEILTSTIVVRRSAFERCGGFASMLDVPRCGFEDLALWLAVREHGEFAYVPEPLVIYRQTPFAERAEKYEAGRKAFIRLIRRRYGVAAETMVAEVNRNTAQGRLQKALLQLDARDFGSALRHAWWSFRIRPTLIFELGLTNRIFRVRNLRRAMGQTGANQKSPANSDKLD